MSVLKKIYYLIELQCTNKYKQKCHNIFMKKKKIPEFPTKYKLLKNPCKFIENWSQGDS